MNKCAYQNDCPLQCEYCGLYHNTFDTEYGTIIILPPKVGYNVQPQTTISPYVCPVCQGRGIVPYGFYSTGESSTSSSAADEKCRSCNGNGILWGGDI